MAQSHSHAIIVHFKLPIGQNIGVPMLHVHL